jgi:hypothetical protein
VTGTDFTADAATAAADPFLAAAKSSERERPCCCNDGLVTIGYEEDGRTYFVLLACRRCREKQGPAQGSRSEGEGS